MPNQLKYEHINVYLLNLKTHVDALDFMCSCWSETLLDLCFQESRAIKTYHMVASDCVGMCIMGALQTHCGLVSVNTTSYHNILYHTFPSCHCISAMRSPICLATPNTTCLICWVGIHVFYFILFGFGFANIKSFKMFLPGNITLLRTDMFSARCVGWGPRAL